jgi:beta-N-acetylhexosaminidase
MPALGGGRFLIVGVPGPILPPEVARFYQHLRPSGFILFARNIESPQQLRCLTEELTRLFPYRPFLCLDQEGGRVARLKVIGQEPPSAEALGRTKDPGLAQRHGELTGKLLRLFGFHWNLAPVLDLGPPHDQANSLQGGRTFGKDPDTVTTFARAFIRGQAACGILSCGKHFPGYTAAKIDPHEELPTVTRLVEELRAWEWKPFAALAGAVETIMVGHIANRHLDPQGIPATLSRRVMEQMLRKELGFGGCIVTDDLDMGAITRRFSPVEGGARALEAGADLLLLCHSFLETAEALARELEKLPGDVLEKKAQRIEALRARLPEPYPFRHEEFLYWNAQVGKLREEVLARGGEGEGGEVVSSPVEQY